MKEPVYLKFPKLTIGDTYGPFFWRPYISSDGSIYPAENVTMECRVRTDTVQNGGVLLLALCNSTPTQTPPNKPNPGNYWYWITSATALQTSVLTPGDYPVDITLAFADGTRRTIIQGSISVSGGTNG